MFHLNLRYEDPEQMRGGTTPSSMACATDITDPHPHIQGTMTTTTGYVRIMITASTSTCTFALYVSADRFHRPTGLQH